MVQQFHGGKLVPLSHPTLVPLSLSHRNSTSSSKWRLMLDISVTWHSPAKYWDIRVPLRTDFPAQEYQDHSKDFPKDDNISAGSVLSRISSLVWAITYLLFAFVLKTFINHHFFGSQECRDLWKMQQKNNAWLSHFYDGIEMKSYQHENI